MNEDATRPPLRIGINALYLLPGGVGGTEIYLRQLLRALADIDRRNRYFVFRNRETGADLVPPAANFQDVLQNVGASFRPSRILWEQLRLPAECRRLSLDVLFNGGFIAPLSVSCPMVTVFHDLQYKRHPEYFRWFDLPFWRILLPAAARRSARIVLPTEAARLDFETFFSSLSARAVVVHHGVEPEFLEIGRSRKTSASPDPFLLTVSTLHPHKNLDTLLRAFRMFHEDRPEYRLVIAGLKGFDAGGIEALCKSLRLSDAVSFTGWIPRADLLNLFAAASAFVYPSRFEGFGMPVLESLASGLPTVCSRIPALVEIAGDAARFFAPESVGDLNDALHEITSDPAARSRLAEAGIRRAQSLTWQRTARETLSVIEAAAG